MSDISLKQKRSVSYWNDNEIKMFSHIFWNRSFISLFMICNYTTCIWMFWYIILSYITTFFIKSIFSIFKIKAASTSDLHRPLFLDWIYIPEDRRNSSHPEYFDIGLCHTTYDQPHIRWCLQQKERQQPQCTIIRLRLEVLSNSQKHVWHFDADIDI